MQAVYNILTRIKNQLKADVNVNTVTFGDIFSIDLEKQTIYPLSHIILNNATLEGDTLNTWRFGVSVMCMDIVDVSKEPTTDIFRGNDNEQDVLNTQHAVLARLFSVLSNDDNLFTIDGEPTVEPFFDEYMNKLTGWTATFDLLIPNEIPSCDANYTPDVCLDGLAIALNSDGDEIKRWTVPSGEEVSEYINDTAIRVRNSNDDIVATDVSLAGALGIDVALPDTNYIINYGGTSTSFDLPTLADEIITFNFT